MYKARYRKKEVKDGKRVSRGRGKRSGKCVSVEQCTSVEQYVNSEKLESVKKTGVLNGRGQKRRVTTKSRRQKSMLIERKLNATACKSDKNGKRLRRIRKDRLALSRCSYGKNKKNIEINIEIKDEESLEAQILRKLKYLVKTRVLTKRVRKISRIAFITALSLFGLDIVDESTRKVVLAVNGQEVEWVMDKGFDSSAYNYELFRDKERVVITKGCKFIESISMDKESPGEIKNVKTLESDSKIVFSWGVPDDIGSDYTYKVVANSKSFSKNYASKPETVKIVSGIEKYIVSLNGKEYETVTPNFEVDLNTLQPGSHTLQISSKDLAGNISEPKNIAFKVDNTKFYLDKYKLATNNKEITDATHELYFVRDEVVVKDGKEVVKKEKMPISIGDNIANFFVNDNMPKIGNPRYIYKDDLVNLFWEKNEFGTRNTEFYIEGKSKKGFKKYKSEKMNYTSGDFIPGYYYKVTTEPSYTVRQTDAYTMDSMVSLDYRKFDRSKIYYFHVASVNEYGNVSRTKTLELDFENFTSINDMKNAVREILYRGKGVESDDYRRVTDDMYNTFTYKTVKKLIDEGLRIVLTPGDIKGYITENHNAKVVSADAQYIGDDSVIVYNVKAPLESLVKEIIRVLDEYPKSPWSKNSDFLEVYNSEKKFFNNGKIDSQEFLVQAIWEYIVDSNELSYKAPKTHGFIKRYYKKILFS